MFFARSQFWSWGRVIHHAIHTHFKFGDKKFNGTQVTVTHRKLRWRPPPSWFWPEVNFDVKYFLNIMLRIFASNLVMIASTARELRLPSWIQDGGRRHFVFHWKSLLRLRSGLIMLCISPLNLVMIASTVQKLQLSTWFQDGGRRHLLGRGQDIRAMLAVLERAYLTS